MNDTLETIIDEIKAYNAANPTAGYNSAAHDKHAGTIRRLIDEKQMTRKDINSLCVVFSYIVR